MRPKTCNKISKIWDTLSRTRPIDDAVRTTKARPYIPVRNRWDGIMIRMAKFMYRGLGISVPFAICYVIGTVVETYGGQISTAAIFLAVISSMFTGLWYSEYLTINRKGSGQLTASFYQLVGELPAFWVSYLYLMMLISTVAVFAKALSSSMDIIANNKVQSFLNERLIKMPLSNTPPDLLAGGAALVSSTVLACGLKHAGILKLAMNLLVLFAYFLFVGFEVMMLENNIGILQHKNILSHEVLIAAGICCVIFSQFIDLGRRSKIEKRPHRTLPVGISLVCGSVFLMAFSLVILLSLTLKKDSNVSGAPLLWAFRELNVGKSFLLLGIIQVIILSMAIGVAGEDMAKQMIVMANEGFLPSSITLESSATFAPVRAYMLGGFLSALLAMFLPHIYLLQFLSSNLLFINTFVVFVVMYRPYRCRNGSYCSAALRPGKKIVPNSKSSLKDDSINFSPKRRKMLRMASTMKSGLRFPLPVTRLKPVGASAPSAFGSSSAQEDDDEECLSIPEDVAEYQENPFSNSDETLSSDTDIDAVILQVKKKLKVSTQKRKLINNPTNRTSLAAFITLILLSVCMITLCSVFFYSLQNEESFQMYIVTIVFLLLVCIVLLIILCRLPKFRGKPKIPGAPWFPATSLLLNLSMLSESVYCTQWLVFPLHCIGLLLYIFWSSRNSVAAELATEKLKTTSGSKDIHLLPLQSSTISIQHEQQDIAVGLLYTTDNTPFAAPIP